MSLGLASLHYEKDVSAGLYSGKIPLWRAHWAAAAATERLGLTHANASVLHSCEARGVTRRAPSMTQSINQSISEYLDSNLFQSSTPPFFLNNTTANSSL